MSNDITFCGYDECTAKECARHHCHKPIGQPVSVALFDCPYMPLNEDDFEREDLGHWTTYSSTMMECSACKRHTPIHRYRFCPHCGKKMKYLRRYEE